VANYFQFQFLSHNLTTSTWFAARKSTLPPSTNRWAVWAKIRQKQPSWWP